MLIFIKRFICGNIDKYVNYTNIFFFNIGPNIFTRLRQKTKIILYTNSLTNDLIKKNHQQKTIRHTF